MPRFGRHYHLLAGCLANLFVVLPLSLEALAQTAPAPPSSNLSGDYRLELQKYLEMHAQFESQSQAYWKLIADKRQIRNEKRRKGEEVTSEDYVLEHPPSYSGPPKPPDPASKETTEPTPPRKQVPVVADFLKFAHEDFGFSPQKPKDELAFKALYARAAKAAGLPKDQVVRIYGFESGGNGKYDVQAGLEYDKPNSRAISTALGYNQLLAANTISLLAQKGDAFVNSLKVSAKALNASERKLLESRIAVLQEMIKFSRSVPDQWSEHEKLAETSRGLGVHAINLDVRIGPLLQTQKLLDSVLFAKRRGLGRALTAAELEMMNLTGDGNGFDMISMPNAMRERVPTANFFRQLGYERNPVVIRNNTVAKLLAATDAKMDKEARLQGAKDMAAAFGD